MHAFQRPGPQHGLKQGVTVTSTRPALLPPHRLPPLGLLISLEGTAQARPDAQVRRPGLGHLTQHRNSGPRVLAALGVVGAGAQHGVRKVAGARLCLRVKRSHGRAVQRRVAAHLVQRQQAHVAVESGVLCAFGGHRAGQLLKAERELAVGLGAQGVVGGDGQHLVQKIEDAGIEVAVKPAGVRHRLPDLGVVSTFTLSAQAQVGAVHREAGDHLTQRRAQGAEREVAPAGVTFGQPLQPLSQSRQLRRQAAAQNQLLGTQQRLAVTQTISGEAAVDGRYLVFVRARHECSAQLRQKVVARGAVNGPALRQALAGFQNLLGHHVDGQGNGDRGRAVLVLWLIGWPCGDLRPVTVPRCPGPILQLPEVARRVVQPVGVVEPDAVHPPLRHQFEQPGVRPGKHAGVLHSQGGQVIDVEEAAVIDLLRGHPPVAQAVVLLTDQAVQRPVVGVQLAHGGVQGARNSRTLAGQRVQPAGDHGGLTRPLSTPLVAQGAAAARQMPSLHGERGQLTPQRVVFAEPAQIKGAAQQARLGARRDRKQAINVADKELAFTACFFLRTVPAHHLQLPLFQHTPVQVAQHRQQHLVLKRAFERLPVNIKKVRVARRLTVFQHVFPVEVVPAAHAHVVGHEVEQQPQPALPGGV